MTCGVSSSPSQRCKAKPGRGRGKGRDEGIRMRPRGPPAVEVDTVKMRTVLRLAEKRMQEKEKRRRWLEQVKESTKRKADWMEQENEKNVCGVGKRQAVKNYRRMLLQYKRTRDERGDE